MKKTELKKSHATVPLRKNATVPVPIYAFVSLLLLKGTVAWDF